jgi:hypothetical protein
MRQPLRQRCNVKLNVFTAITPEKVIETYSDVYKRDTSSQNKSRRPAPDVKVPFNEMAAGNVNPMIPMTPRLHPVSKLAAQSLQSLHELLPYLFVSFCTGGHLPTEVITDDGAAFTHIVKIAHETSQRQAGLAEIGRDVKRGLHTLVLFIPNSAPQRRGMRGVRNVGKRMTTLLTEYQLLAARDFLSLALPYYSETHPASEVLEGPIESADRVRVLITAPAEDGAATDVMSVAVCYITFVSEESAQIVLECIKKEEEVPGTWKDVIGEADGIRLINYAAVMGE